MSAYFSEIPQLGILLVITTGFVWAMFGPIGAIVFRFLGFGGGIFVFYLSLKRSLKDHLDLSLFVILFSTTLWWLSKFIISIDLNFGLLLSFWLFYLLHHEKNNFILLIISSLLLFHFKISSLVLIGALVNVYPPKFHKQKVAIVFGTLLLNVAIFLMIKGSSQLEGRALNMPLDIVLMNVEGILVSFLAPWFIFIDIVPGTLKQINVMAYFRLIILMSPFVALYFTQKKTALKLLGRTLLSILFIAIFIVILSRKDHESYGMKSYSGWIEIVFYLGIILAYSSLSNKKIRYCILTAILIIKVTEGVWWWNEFSQYEQKNNEWSFYQKVSKVIDQTKPQKLLTFCTNNVNVAEFYLENKISIQHYALDEVFAVQPPALDETYPRNSLAMIPNDCLSRIERTRDSEKALEANKWIETIAKKKYLGEIEYNKFEKYKLYYLE